MLTFFFDCFTQIDLRFELTNFSFHLSNVSPILHERYTVSCVVSETTVLFLTEDASLLYRMATTEELSNNTHSIFRLL